MMRRGYAARQRRTGRGRQLSISTTISVVIPAHNSAQTLRRALCSALAQSRRPDEIIVVDDLSTDGTRDIALGFRRDDIRIVATERRMGAGGARNVGIRAAAGNLVAFLDSDDEWLPQKLEKQIAMLELDSRLGFVTCDTNVVGVDGEMLGDIYGGRRVAAGSEAWKPLLACNFVSTPSVIVWRHHLIALRGFDESMKVGEDQDMWIRLGLRTSLGYVPEPLVLVHMRPGSLSSWRLEDQLAYTLPMVKRHLESQRLRLSSCQKKRILGERLNRLGRVAYAQGNVLLGAKFLYRSMRLGYRPMAGTLYLVSAAPPLARMKRHFRRSAAA